MFCFGEKKEKELLSVIIPSYNHEKYIGQAIESVLSQTYRNLELIIIDDGSEDNSVPFIKQYDDPRITLVVQQNEGAHRAINRGLEMAKGDYLAILNSDDIYSKDRFAIMIRELEKDSELDFVCSYLEVIDADGKSLGIKKGWENMLSWEAPNKDLSLQAESDFVSNLLVTNFISTTSNFLFTRKLYQEIGGMRNLRFAHDWDFALRAAEVTKCKIVKKPLMKYRVHATNTISSNRKWMLFEVMWIWASNLGRFYSQLFGGTNDKKNLVRILESFNLQGNDKVFWAILMYIEAKKAEGIICPEEAFLDDKELRESLFPYINE